MGRVILLTIILMATVSGAVFFLAKLFAQRYNALAEGAVLALEIEVQELQADNEALTQALAGYSSMTDQVLAELASAPSTLDLREFNERIANVVTALRPSTPSAIRRDND